MKKSTPRAFGAKLLALVLCLVIAASCLTCASAAELIAKKKKKSTATATPAATAAATVKPTATPVPENPALAAAQEIVDYLDEHGCLPDNFLTKKEAQALGWDPSYNYVSDVAPGKSLGGSYFGNYEGQLPSASGRKWSECDCYYNGGKRNAYRLLYSNDGLYYYTEDHYTTFTELFPTGKNSTTK